MPLTNCLRDLYQGSERMKGRWWGGRACQALSQCQRVMIWDAILCHPGRTILLHCSHNPPLDMGTERQLVRRTRRAKGYVYLYVCLRDYSGDLIERLCLISSRSAGMSVGHDTPRKNGLREDAVNQGNRRGKVETWMLKNKRFKNLANHLLLWPEPPPSFLEASSQSSCFISSAEEHLLSTDCTRHHKHVSGIWTDHLGPRNAAPAHEKCQTTWWC